MQSLWRKIAEVLRLSRLEKRWRKVARVLAVIVVFCTTYMLILPAITLTKETYCGYEEHIHDDSCYTYEEVIATAEAESGEVESQTQYYTLQKVLTCTLTEHTHSDECYESDDGYDLSELNKETQDIIYNVINRIDALPANDEISEKMAEYEENGDEDGENEYLSEIAEESYSIYFLYDQLGHYQKYITNIDKLLELEWLWGVQTLADSNNPVTIPIYAVNNYTWASNHPPLIVYGGSASSMGVTNGFFYWMAIVVDSDSSGNLYVSQTIKNNGSSDEKYNLAPSSSDGFVLFIWCSNSYHTSAYNNVNVGDYVSVDFNYKTTTAEQSSAIGNVTFGVEPAEDEDDYLEALEKDNTDELTIVESIDTYDLIKINLYNYGTNINNLYGDNEESKTLYPGFQQDYGTKSSFSVTSTNKIGVNYFNFGNTVTEDLTAGATSVTSGSGLNSMNSASRANRPTEGVMNLLLGDDGYPVSAVGTSLAYLFTENTYATKENTDNINGLFQQNPVTGEYYYNSHENHAQFDYDTNTFILYEQVISANFMMYPFGNFLPFTDIVHDSKKSSEIDATYLTNIAKRASSKSNQAIASWNEYTGLNTALTSFVSCMNTLYPTGWTAKDCVNQYFYESTIADSSGSYITFDDSDLERIYTLDYDIPSNFYFGMELEMDFMQPKNGLTGFTGEEEMVFYFTGDDDVWVYIDGVLFLDLSGIHRHVGGKIDFVRGEVSYYELQKSTGDVADEPYATVTFAEILEDAGVDSTGVLNSDGAFTDYSIHSFKMFYMERGAGSGVCRMNFNLSLVTDHSLTITKEVSADGEIDDILGSPYYYFQVFKSENGEKSDELFVVEGTEYTVMDSSGNQVRTDVVDANGIIKLKEGETALIAGEHNYDDEFYVVELIDEDVYRQYKMVVYNENKIEATVTEGVMVGSETYVAYESDVYVLNDSSSYTSESDFEFYNTIDSDQLGALEIKKELLGVEDDSTFTFLVTLDGDKLPAGTQYTLISADGTETSAEIETAGEIPLKAGETALIVHILAGSEFTVTETAESKGDYILSYTDDGNYYTTDGDTASGIILPASTAEAIVVTAVNGVDGTSVTLDGEKTLTNSDGNEYTYSFELKEVTDLTGETEVEDGINLKTDVKLVGEDGESVTDSFSFTLNFYDVDLDVGEYTYYYKICEIIDESLTTVTDYDETVYIAEVTLTKDENGLSAEIDAIYKNGVLLEDDGAVEFENSLVGQLTVSKEVTGEYDDTDTSTEFEFEIELIYDDEPLNGTYTLITTDSDGNETQSEITVTDGIATAYISHMESFTIKGLPVKTAVTVTEKNDNYFIYHRVGSAQTDTQGDTAQSEITTGENKIQFINHVPYTLPETGSGSYYPYIFGGLLISLSAVFLLCYINKRRERRLESSRL